MIAMTVGRRVHGILIVAMLIAARSATAAASDLAALERAVAGDPEDMMAAAAYRQAAIAAGDFDRPIAFLEKLAKRRGTGPHIHFSLALAYVDKVPTSGDIKRLYLGRDAMNALTKSIELRPTAAAFYVRGLINLFYNSFIFHRTDRGVADLTRALTMSGGDTPPPLLLRVYTALGDGYLRLESPAKARETWAAGLARFPGDEGLKERLAKSGEALQDVVTTALTASRRVDTSLSGFLPIP
jgi:tetratricopeptide (TPR) repeat protein